ncbi:MAG: winged helix-turn-helix transcriptional regulator [Desulfobacteraceae bacterium]|nr:winged helix-turn-helix transcriptional regulator [Desulfobacteraceae bacterium]
METGPHIRLVLWKAAKAVEKEDQASIINTGLCLTDFSILEALLHKGPLPINRIGGKILLSSGSMTAAINRLQSGGYVKRIKDETDGRYFHVHLTASGQRMITEAYGNHKKNLDHLFDVLTEAEKTEFVRLLKKIGYHAGEFKSLPVLGKEK